MDTLTPNQRLFLDKLPSYSQTTSGYYRLNNRYCVMGVACDVSELGSWETGRLVGRLEAMRYTDGDDRCILRGVSEWLGLNSCNPIIAVLDNIGPISANDANDEHNWNFATLSKLFRRLFIHGEPATVDEHGNILKNSGK